jgi:GDPmannose 4,6-dehydratase
MYLILQHKEPDDFVVATGSTMPVRDFVVLSFSEMGMVIEFKGTEANVKKGGD